MGPAAGNMARSPACWLTPANRQTVAAAVVKLLSPLSVTPQMVEQLDHLQFQNYPARI
jgi:hypothetical protein